MRNVNTLVAVAGHATFLNSVEHVPDDPSNEAYWYLQGFQKGEVPFYLNHMRRGADLVAANQSSIGLMSGGRTRRAGGKWGEGSSYLAVADAQDFWQGPNEALVADVRSRFDVEEFARDSLENVLFSVMKYRRVVKSLPQHIIMVGWKQKKERFEHHARTLGIPDGVFEYEGVPLDAYDCNAPFTDVEGFNLGEKIAVAQWNDNPLGDSGQLLAKREERNPFGITPPYSWAEYVRYAREQPGWNPCQEIIAAAAIEGASVA